MATNSDRFPARALLCVVVAWSALWIPSRTRAATGTAVILATDGRSCQIPNAVLAAGDVYLRLSDVAACGGSAHLDREDGLIVAERDGVRLTLWPWGAPLALRNGLEILELPASPWLWHEGGFYVRPEVVEAWLGGAVAMKMNPEDLPLLHGTPATYRVDGPTSARAVGLRVLIDPGHGGDDLGARGIDGTLEKDVTLAIARRLAGWLAAEGYSVRLSRGDDSYPTLAERVRDANAWDADLFVSLHCNSAPRRTARGIETYVMSREASDPRALELAQFENAFDQAQVEDGDLLHAVLGAVARQAQENTTTSLATVFHSTLISDLGVEDRGVRRAPLFVLAGATMPAFLIELGFLSNPDDAALLRDGDYQLRLARQLGRAIDAIVPYLRTRVDGAAAAAGPRRVAP